MLAFAALVKQLGEAGEPYLMPLVPKLLERYADKVRVDIRMKWRNAPPCVTYLCRATPCAVFREGCSCTQRCRKCPSARGFRFAPCVQPSRHLAKHEGLTLRLYAASAERPG